MRAIPELETIMEFNPNDKTGMGEVVSIQEFNRLFIMYYRAGNYVPKRWAVPGGHVYAFTSPSGELVTNVWHVPSAADYVIV